MNQCAYCKKSPSVLQICIHCEKVTYCSESHKNSHLSQHKSDCFPATVQSEDDCGRYWVASRDISKGELIFSEAAIVIGPNTETESPLYPTCLGCCRGTNTSYSCSKCHWPVCSRKCEKVSQHADFECKIFRKNKVHSSARPQYYLYIQFLRALLLNKVKPLVFKSMMSLETHTECRRSHKEESQISKSFYRFLTEDCNLQHDFDFVDHVVGVNRINSYSADILNSGTRKRSCTALFCQMSLLNHDCLPNTRSVIFENSDLSIQMDLFASTDIYKGQNITQQYVPVVKGTMNRRTALKEWFFDCNCKRCADPIEFGTFFSCIKCNNCTKGFIRPDNSLDYSSNWKCNNSECDYSQSSEEIQTLIKEHERNIQKYGQSVQSLESILNDIVTRDLHIHHYLAINVQYDIAQKIVKALNNYKNIDEIRRGVRYCRNILKVVNIICPGYSYYRGVILYFLGNLLYSLYEMNELSNNDCKEDDCEIKELCSIIKEGIIILDVEPKESVYKEMVTELETYHQSLISLHNN